MMYKNDERVNKQMNSPHPVRIGILGCARIARRAMVDAIAISGCATLDAIASHTPGKAAAWGAEFNVPKAYASFDQLLDDPTIDAVYIPLTNELHRTWTLKSAAANKHVLCEKPLAINANEAEEMAMACRERGVLLMEAFMWRHHPRVLAAKQIIDQGTIGELRLMKLDLSFEAEPDEWILYPDRGGGAMNDVGCYGIDAARYFAGDEPIDVHAWSRLNEFGADMTSIVSLRFPGDVLAQIECSLESPDRCRLEIIGTRGSIEFPEGVVPSGTSQLTITKAGSIETIFFEQVDPYAEQIKVFAASISAGRLIHAAEDGLANNRVLDAIHRSIKENQRALP